MNRIARIRFGAVAFMLVAGLTALGQDNGDPGPLSAEYVGAETVVRGEKIVLGIEVSGGNAPYNVAISDDGPIVGGSFDEVAFSGDGPTFEFTYTAPSDDFGPTGFTVTIEDSDEGSDLLTLPISIDVACDPGQPLAKYVGAESVVRGEKIVLGIEVCGGRPPYTVTILDEERARVFPDDCSVVEECGPIEGGSLDMTGEGEDTCSCPEGEDTCTCASDCAGPGSCGDGICCAVGDGPVFEFTYTAPSKDVGSNAFMVTVKDMDGGSFTLPICLPVLCPGLGLCTEKLTNFELRCIGVLGFEEEVVGDPGTVGSRLSPPNLPPANVLNRLDIDKDGQPDNVTDTDGDGLPDSWELGGAEEEGNDRVVFYPAPSAIVPGTPPTPIFTRRAVATSALSADTDGDGLSDFVEVFGLKFIDEDGNGRLDPDEWADFNGDGMPSVGEFPMLNVTRDALGAAEANPFGLLNDFDGFVFTDPTNADTDGDRFFDGEDKDPLINPRSFGIIDDIIVRFDRSTDDDVDKDGIGNGMDMGNDLTEPDANVTLQGVDNPANMEELLDLFRDDLLGTGKIPEWAVEDLLGADWDGNGLWRTTDVLNRHPIVDPRFAELRPPDLFFILGETGDDEIRFYFPQTLDGSTEEEMEAGKKGLLEVVKIPGYDKYNGRGIGLAWQELLRPPTTTNFMPDRKIWAILYAWRMPGFDIDGDGFVGSDLLAPDSIPDASVVAIENDITVADADARIDLIRQDQITILESREPTEPKLDGVIEVPGLADFFQGCGGFGVASLTLLLVGLGLVRLRRRR